MRPGGMTRIRWRAGRRPKERERTARRARVRTYEQAVYEELCLEAQAAEYQFLPCRKGKQGYQYTMREVHLMLDRAIHEGRIMAYGEYCLYWRRYIVFTMIVLPQGARQGAELKGARRRHAGRGGQAYLRTGAACGVPRVLQAPPSAATWRGSGALAHGGRPARCARAEVAQVRSEGNAEGDCVRRRRVKRVAQAGERERRRERSS